MNLWRCPHPALFLQEICDALDAMQNHGVVTVPARLIPSFQETLTDRWSGTRPIRTLKLDGRTALVDALSPLFHTGGGTVSLAGLKDLALKGSSTLAVTLPASPCRAESELFDFLKGDLAPHAERTRRRGGFLDWNLLVVAPADRDAPAAVPGLRSFRWWGSLRHSDLEYAIEDAFRDIFGANARQDQIRWWWLYPLCRGIGAGWPELVDTLCRDTPEDMDALMDVLAKHDLHTAENGRLVRDFLNGAAHAPSRGEPPRGPAAELWRRGLLDLDGDGDFAPHPAALLAAGRRDDLVRMVVRAQTQFFLPMVQKVHRLLRRQVEAQMACDLEELIPPNSNLDAARDEVGILYALLAEMHQVRGKPVHPHVVEAARHWSELRNSAAHFDLLPLEAVREALSLYEELLAAEAGATAG